MTMNVIEGGFAKKDTNVADMCAEDNAAAVAFLETALEEAKKGHAVMAMLILVNRDDSVSSGWSATETMARPFVTVGALEAIKADYMRMNVEQR